MADGNAERNDGHDSGDADGGASASAPSMGLVVSASVKLCLIFDKLEIITIFVAISKIAPSRRCPVGATHYHGCVHVAIRVSDCWHRASGGVLPQSTAGRSVHMDIKTIL